jgi:ubiquinone/menaquinone biosynthesis C-methylase UbiE
LTQHPKQSAYTEARIAYWEEYEQSNSRFDILRRGYRERLIGFYQFLIPPGMRVLELGSGEGDVLAAVKPAVGVGIDFCPSMIHRAHSKYPGLRFVEGDAHFVDLKGEKFDFIIVSDLVNDLWYAHHH